MTRCTFKRPDGYGCGSYAFNLARDGIDQGTLCDVHYWQDQATRARSLAMEEAAKIALNIAPNSRIVAAEIRRAGGAGHD
ncbi:MAG: hypothetical protein WC023_06285 [Rhodocyclaceae bacterium]